MRERAKSELAVGIFVFITLLLFGYGIMNYTNELGLFEPVSYLKTHLNSPEGLANGSAVRLFGVGIGRITNIEFVSDISKQEVIVTMKMNASDLDRIGKDAIAKIQTVGLLGDNIINIDPGHPEKGHVKPWDTIEGKNYEDRFAALGKIADKLGVILDKIDQGGIESISSTIQNASEITDKIKKGEGTLGKLIYSDETINQLNSTIAELNRITRQINNGPGGVHTLLYDEQFSSNLKKVSTQLADAAQQINSMMSEIKDKDLANKLGQVVDNLATTSRNLAQIAQSIEQGEGTIGALVKDPTLYDDLKVILQGAKRSEALKYAIQRTIQRRRESSEPQGPQNPPATSSAPQK